MAKEDLKAVMEVKDLVFTYPGAPAPTLKKNNLTIYKNKITAMIGPSDESGPSIRYGDGPKTA